MCFKLSSLTESYAFWKSTNQVDKNFPFSVYLFIKPNNVKIWQKFCDLFEIHPGREIKPYFFEVSFVVYYTVAQRWNLTTASHLFFKKYFSWTRTVANCFPTVINVENCFPTVMTVANCFPTVITFGQFSFVKKCIKKIKVFCFKNYFFQMTHKRQFE